MNLNKQAVYTVIANIPRGAVASYGQIAALSGHPGRARWVGRLLRDLPTGSTLPWHRVVNHSGAISAPSLTRATELLIAEGVVVKQGKISMKRYQWRP